MSHFALLWKARAIEKYRRNYELEKLNSLEAGNTPMPNRTLFQRFRHGRNRCKKKFKGMLKSCCPESIRKFCTYIRTDQTFPNFMLKSVVGFLGGIILTYAFFMFFVFQLSISLVHATVMCSVIGVLLTLGLAFSYRVRCLVFLLLPQLFSEVGRYTLMGYALILILTGPAKNTLHNSEVLSESMACGQEQLKSSVRQIKESITRPFNAMKETIQLMVESVREVAGKVKETLLSINRMVLSIVRVIQSALNWLSSIVSICSKKVGTPSERCHGALEDGVLDCQARLGAYFSWLCNVVYVAKVACESAKALDAMCVLVDFVGNAVVGTIKKKLRTFSNHVKTMLFVNVHIHHAYSFNTNSSRSASQVAAGIVTEIRHRADRLLQWFSWMSCITSLFLLLIIFRAKYYQHMYLGRMRYDNRYVTRQLRELDLRRARESRDTVLPLNHRERTECVTTTSFRLLASEKRSLARSAVFLSITTFKLLVHMAADYSLYWVLRTVRYHGRFEAPPLPSAPDGGVVVSGAGPLAAMLRGLTSALAAPLSAPPRAAPISCLPDPEPPDARRYIQIGILIILLWALALLQPYGLRLRHVVMDHYRPERARARAVWLYNHILRRRGGFLKLARRKLHQEFKLQPQDKYTFKQWLDSVIPCAWLRALLRTGSGKDQCVLCGAGENANDPDTLLIRCETPGCAAVYCASCFEDIGRLCTACLQPADYGDISDISLERGSSEDTDEEPYSTQIESPVDEENLQKSPEWPSTSDGSDKDTSPNTIRQKIMKFRDNIKKRGRGKEKKDDNSNTEKLRWRNKLFKKRQNRETDSEVEKESKDDKHDGRKKIAGGIENKEDRGKKIKDKVFKRNKNTNTLKGDEKKKHNNEIIMLNDGSSTEYNTDDALLKKKKKLHKDATVFCFWKMEDRTHCTDGNCNTDISSDSSNMSNNHGYRFKNCDCSDKTKCVKLHKLHNEMTDSDDTTKLIEMERNEMLQKRRIRKLKEKMHREELERLNHEKSHKERIRNKIKNASYRRDDDDGRSNNDKYDSDDYIEPHKNLKKNRSIQNYNKDVKDQYEYCDSDSDSCEEDCYAQTVENWQDLKKLTNQRRKRRRSQNVKKVKIRDQPSQTRVAMKDLNESSPQNIDEYFEDSDIDMDVDENEKIPYNRYDSNSKKSIQKHFPEDDITPENKHKAEFDESHYENREYEIARRNRLIRLRRRCTNPTKRYAQYRRPNDNISPRYENIPQGSYESDLDCIGICPHANEDHTHNISKPSFDNTLNRRKCCLCNSGSVLSDIKSAIRTNIEKLSSKNLCADCWKDSRSKWQHSVHMDNETINTNALEDLPPCPGWKFLKSSVDDTYKKLQRNLARGCHVVTVNNRKTKKIPRLLRKLKTNRRRTCKRACVKNSNYCIYKSTFPSTLTSMPLNLKKSSQYITTQPRSGWKLPHKVPVPDKKRRKRKVYKKKYNWLTEIYAREMGYEARGDEIESMDRLIAAYDQLKLQGGRIKRRKQSHVGKSVVGPWYADYCWPSELETPLCLCPNELCTCRTRRPDLEEYHVSDDDLPQRKIHRGDLVKSKWSFASLGKRLLQVFRPRRKKPDVDDLTDHHHLLTGLDRAVAVEKRRYREAENTPKGCLAHCHKYYEQHSDSADADDDKHIDYSYQDLEDEEYEMENERRLEKILKENEVKKKVTSRLGICERPRRHIDEASLQDLRDELCSDGKTPLGSTHTMVSHEDDIDISDSDSCCHIAMDPVCTKKCPVKFVKVGGRKSRHLRAPKWKTCLGEKRMNIEVLDCSEDETRALSHIKVVSFDNMRCGPNVFQRMHSCASRLLRFGRRAQSANRAEVDVEMTERADVGERADVEERADVGERETSDIVAQRLTKEVFGHDPDDIQSLWYENPQVWTNITAARAKTTFKHHSNEDNMDRGTQTKTKIKSSPRDHKNDHIPKCHENSLRLGERKNDHIPKSHRNRFQLEESQCIVEGKCKVCQKPKSTGRQYKNAAVQSDYNNIKRLRNVPLEKNEYRNYKSSKGNRRQKDKTKDLDNNNSTVTYIPKKSVKTSTHKNDYFDYKGEINDISRPRNKEIRHKYDCDIDTNIKRKEIGNIFKKIREEQVKRNMKREREASTKHLSNMQEGHSPRERLIVKKDARESQMSEKIQHQRDGKKNMEREREASTKRLSHMQEGHSPRERLIVKKGARESQMSEKVQQRESPKKRDSTLKKENYIKEKIKNVKVERTFSLEAIHHNKHASTIDKHNEIATNKVKYYSKKCKTCADARRKRQIDNIIPLSLYDRAVFAYNARVDPGLVDSMDSETARPGRPHNVAPECEKDRRASVNDEATGAMDRDASVNFDAGVATRLSLPTDGGVVIDGNFYNYRHSKLTKDDKCQVTGARARQADNCGASDVDLFSVRDEYFEPTKASSPIERRGKNYAISSRHASPILPKYNCGFFEMLHHSSASGRESPQAARRIEAHIQTILSTSAETPARERSSTESHQRLSRRNSGGSRSSPDLDEKSRKIPSKLRRRRREGKLNNSTLYSFVKNKFVKAMRTGQGGSEIISKNTTNPAELDFQ